MEHNALSIKSILSNAWQLTKGLKWPIWAPILVLIAITAGINFLASLLFGFLGLPMIEGSFTAAYSISDLVIAFIVEVIIIFFTAPLIVGAQMVALKRLRGESISASTGFYYWSKWFYLGITILILSLGAALINVVIGSLITLSYNVGFWLVGILQILAILAFIVFYAFYFFSILFVADQNKNPIDAFITSFSMVRPQWFQVCKIMACIAIGFLVVLLPFLILSIFGMMVLSYIGVLLSVLIAIWAIPYFHLIVSGVYNELTK